MRGFWFILSLIVVVSSLFLASGVWTYYPNHEYWQTNSANFPTGFMHGSIAPVMLVAGIFSDYGIYETNNSGWFYDLFFIIGFLLVWAGGSGSSHVIKNYYQNQNNDKNLKKDDLKEINKLIEKNVSQKVNKSNKSKDKNEKGFFKKLISKILN